MEIKEILSRCDHTLLSQTATWDEIRAVCDDGMKYHTASVCIPPCYVKKAKEYVGDRLAICTVIGFPNGYNSTAVKVFETSDAVDASGRRRPVAIEGSEFELPVETVIMAIGNGPNPIVASTTPGMETNKRGNIVADEETCATTKEGVFAGGDIVTGAATVILAMGAGKKAAAAIDEYLKSKKG